jgi:hypothetical protein
VAHDFGSSTDVVIRHVDAGTLTRTDAVSSSPFRSCRVAVGKIQTASPASGSTDSPSITSEVSHPKGDASLLVALRDVVVRLVPPPWLTARERHADSLSSEPMSGRDGLDVGELTRLYEIGILNTPTPRRRIRLFRCSRGPRWSPVNPGRRRSYRSSYNQVYLRGFYIVSAVELRVGRALHNV